MLTISLYRILRNIISNIKKLGRDVSQYYFFPSTIAGKFWQRRWGAYNWCNHQLGLDWPLSPDCPGSHDLDHMTCEQVDTMTVLPAQATMLYLALCITSQLTGGA